jgi:predicted NBD/HSP70 family sugar kinase
VPALLDNDVNLMALGEYRHRLLDNTADPLLFIKIGTGIGCGIITASELHRGAQGTAGDIGHIRIPGDALPHCACGHAGCLEAVAGGGALVRNLAKEGLDVHTVRDLSRLDISGTPQARRAVADAARRIGGVLAAVVSFYNPAVIVVGGPLIRYHELIAGIRSGIYDRALVLATKSLRIETSQIGDKAGIAGGVLLAQRHLLSPTGVGSLLARRRSNPI